MAETERLHPDFPPIVTDAADRWNQPDPLDDIATALEVSDSGLTLTDLATVERYDINSDAGKWAPGGEVWTELQMSLLGTLRDGRWFALEGGNDYTGWGCQDYADFYAHEDRADVIRNGLTVEGRNHLALAPAAHPSSDQADR